jgi:hypothetical protein
MLAYFSTVCNATINGGNKPVRMHKSLSLDLCICHKGMQMKMAKSHTGFVVRIEAGAIRPTMLHAV